MLAEKAQELNEEAKSLKELREMEHLDQVWEARTKQVGSLLTKILAPASSIMAIVKSFPRSERIESTKLNSTTKKLMQIVSLVKTDPATDSLPQEITRLVSLLEQTTDEVGREARRLWLNARDTLPVPDVVPLRPFRHHPDPTVRQAALQAESIEQRLQQLRSLDLPEPKDILEVAAVLKDRDRVRSELPTDLPPAVTEFFAKVGAGEARISDLSEEVLQWINERNLADEYLVKPRSTTSDGAFPRR